MNTDFRGFKFVSNTFIVFGRLLWSKRSDEYYSYRETLTILQSYIIFKLKTLILKNFNFLAIYNRIFLVSAFVSYSINFTMFICGFYLFIKHINKTLIFTYKTNKNIYDKNTLRFEISMQPKKSAHDRLWNLSWTILII